ncbi:MAG TPA: hypothetical protein VM364_14895 [Vicinamibacterales bacterium]|nr:hypothetical protein [Vicinamibacterales bacterium]
MASVTLSPAARAALDVLTSDLRRVFGNRLVSISAYALTADPDAEIRTVVLVDRLAFDDLAACVPLARAWDARGLAVPLLLERDEFVRTLDVFPLEYGEIIATHVPVYGDDPFAGVQVADADRRRACELQAKSHLIHLREGFLESRGDPRAVSALIGASAEGFRRLLLNLLALVAADDGAGDLDERAEAHLGVAADLTREVLAARGAGPSTIADPTALLARYITAVERIWEFVDAWKRP